MNLKRKRLSAKQILYQAVRILKNHGWTRGNFTRRGRYCALGAMQKAAFGNPCINVGPNQSSFDAARWRLKQVINTDSIIGGVITSWNDDPSRRRRQVIAALRKAAKIVG